MSVFSVAAVRGAERLAPPRLERQQAGDDSAAAAKTSPSQYTGKQACCGDDLSWA